MIADDRTSNLCEEKKPAQTGLKWRRYCTDAASVSRITPPSRRAQKEGEEDLHGSDPRDLRGREGEEVDVVGLEDSEGVDDAPCVCDYDVGTYTWILSMLVVRH